MEHVNGDYSLSIIATDILARNTFKWELGELKLWFKEGLENGDNTGVKEMF